MATRFTARRLIATACILALLTGCGGGGGGSDSPPPPITVTPPAPPPPPPPPVGGTCSLASRLNFVAEGLRQDYLFPELLANVDPARFQNNGRSDEQNIQDFINALTAPARAEGKDKIDFSYLTSITEENALINSGSTAGFGIRLFRDNNRLFISEAFEGAPGLAAGLDRGVEVLAIGTSSSNLVDVSDLLATDQLGNALGPNDPGVTRAFRIRNVAGTESVVTASKANFALDPVSDRYGSRIIDDGGRRVGYLNLRTFIVGSADQQLRQVFADFKAQNVTEVVIDLRYNGGGLVSLAELLTNLLGANRSPTDVQSRTVFNQRLSANNRTAFFSPQPQSIAPTKIAFIGTAATASASELVMNALLPYYGNNIALIGANTFGKPSGQIRRDRPECDDALRVLAFTTVNSANQGNYFNGLASLFPRTCRAADDVTRQLGDPTEASLRTALDFLAGRPCTPILGGGITTQAVGQNRGMLRPEAPSAAQYEIPGFF